MQIEGSVALVTGAHRGIGLAFARALVARGAAKVYAGSVGPGNSVSPDASRFCWTSPISSTSTRLPPRPTT